MHIIEKIIALVTFLGLLIWQSGIELLIGKAIFGLGMMLLMVYYLLFGFAYYNHIHIHKIFTRNSYVNVSGKNILAGILSGLAYFAILTGTTYQIVLWPGAVVMGFSTAPIALIILISMILQKVSNPDYRPSNFYRSVILSLSFILLVALPYMTKVKIFYHHYPDSVINAFENYQKSLQPEDYDIIAKEISRFEKK